MHFLLIYYLYPGSSCQVTHTFNCKTVLLDKVAVDNYHLRRSDLSDVTFQSDVITKLKNVHFELYEGFLLRYYYFFV
jgi:hypothetical protein